MKSSLSKREVEEYIRDVFLRNASKEEVKKASLEASNSANKWMACATAVLYSVIFGLRTANLAAMTKAKGF